MVKVGMIGCGYWGPNLLRNFYQLTDVKVAVCDSDEKRLNYVSRNYPGIRTTDNYLEMINDTEIDAVVIATPAHTHFSLSREALLNNKHVLVEKPLALSSQECTELIDLSHKNKKVLMVGHTFEYNAAVRKLKEYIDGQELGDIYYIYSSRLNLGKVRQDVNAMWNFAPHDVSIIQYLLGRQAIKVSARGFTYLQPGIADVVFMTLEFPGNIQAHIHISWLDPHKVRQMTIVGSKKMVVYDDVSSEAKIQVYDKGIDKKRISDSLGNFESFGDFQLLQRAGDIYIPMIDFKEPLVLECKHFIECIMEGKKPLTDGEDGLRVVRVLEAADKSLQEGGAAIEIGEL